MNLDIIVALEGNEYTPNSQHAYEKAELGNLVVCVPAADEIQIDIDSQQAFDKFMESWGILKAHTAFCDCPVLITPSKSGLPKCHVRIKSYCTLGPMERIALQAVLGSDITRELLSVVQVFNNDPESTLLLETPKVAEQVEEWKNNQSQGD